MHKIKEIAVALLQFISVCSLMSMVWVTTPELPADEIIGQWVWFGYALLLSAGCILLVCLLRIRDRIPWGDLLRFRYFNVYVAWSLLLMGVVEALWGFRQLYGFSVSRHSGYALTGSFFNPGPYGGYLAMILPVCLHLYLCIPSWNGVSGRYKIEKATAAIAGLLMLSVLPATMSRSAWVASIISCVWVSYMHFDKRRWILLWQRHKKRYISWGMVAIFALVLGSAGIFLLKPDSALGRLFIWKITFKAISNHPWGCDEGFAYAYGEAQENYFASGVFADWEERVAGSPEFAFNEYLEVALTNGILICGMILLIIGYCLWLGIKLGRYGACGALISLLIFSFSSYPMHFPAFIIAGLCLLMACGLGDIIGKMLIVFICLAVWSGGYMKEWSEEQNACREWMNARMLYRSKAYIPAGKAYKELYPYLRDKGDFLFEYGHTLHRSGFYDESNKYLEEAGRYNSDPMILNIMGKNYQELHCYTKAENCFQISINRLPGRIYPYYLLAKLYAIPENRDKEKFEEMKRVVLVKEPKVHSTAIEEMRREVKEISKNWDNIK